MGILIDILTIVLVLVSIFMVLLVLMQRGSASGGLGAAMGGGMAESALGAESSSVLSRWTRNVAIVFFVMVFGLYLGRLKVHEDAMDEQGSGLPQFQEASDGSAASALQQLLSGSNEEAASPAVDTDETIAPATPGDALEDDARALQDQE